MAITNSIPSPDVLQMSKFIRMLGGGRRERDRVRKPKAPKKGSWSLYEDQTLVVLVHDLGPNWGRVSDAINSTPQFKRIFRKPEECEKRHKILTDKNAEDYGSTLLSGIPKGSAMKLFQRLQRPMEEKILRADFDKIIKIEKEQRHRRNQNSRVVALSPNKLN